MFESSGETTKAERDQRQSDTRYNRVGPGDVLLVLDLILLCFISFDHDEVGFELLN